MKDVEYSNDIGEAEDSSKEESITEAEESTTNPTISQRKIIHKANISANVKELTVAQEKITEKVSKYNGYIVESNNFQESDSRSHGRMVVRVPEEHFETFLSEAEGQVTKVLERNITGEDVTEQYVDLESRLKSKRAVEARLLVFMESAEKTEDLLKISADLAKVQEEIEVIVGKIKYLDNQTSFSTIELNFYEDRVIVPSIENKELNTWEKTKKQFVQSVNALLMIGSWIIVFLLGNLPVLLVIGIVSFLSIWFIRKRRKDKE
ncbi:DUF4349 domain-containing protein [Psychrobacillus sp. BL-248-WT-3]|nr:DUF4349 domain-containing protein [Psychrobacillus sp. BL-248-WT-3]NME06449.1 DUF4349 domain-containing protein [Psychrobacillus sp. BL-248-WT-3]